jgi:hypothetical protein
MPLISGSYNLAHYTTFNEGDRRRNARWVATAFGKVSPVEFKVSVSEKRWEATVDAIQKRILFQKSALTRRMSHKHRPSKPTRLR